MDYQRIKDKYLRNESMYIWALIVIFLIIRIAYIGLYGNFDKSTFMDANGYNEYAKTILLNSEWITETQFLASWREPVYPLLVAFVYAIFGIENFWAVYLIQTLLGSLMLYIVYRLAYWFSRRHSVAIITLIWAGAYIFYIRWTGELLRETLVYLLVSLLFYSFTLQFRKSGKAPKYALLPAVVYALLIHTDGRYLFYAPFLLIIFIVFFEPVFSALKQYVVFGVVVLLLTLPWTYRNYLAYGEIIVISEYTLNLSQSDISARKELFDTEPINTAYSSLHYGNYNRQYPSDEERNKIMRGFRPSNRSDDEIIAIRRGNHAATTWIGRKWYGLISMWSPIKLTSNYAPFPMAYFQGPYSKEHNLFSALQYGSLLPLCLVTMIWSIRKKNKSILIFLVPILTQLILHFITFGIERYRHPIDSFIIILGVNGLVLTYDTARKWINLRVHKPMHSA